MKVPLIWVYLSSVDVEEEVEWSEVDSMVWMAEPASDFQ